MMDAPCTTCLRGDRVEYTGKSEMLHGELAYEYLVAEGHRKGELGWTYRVPNSAKPEGAKGADDE